MERHASLVCADYSTDRGNPGIVAVNVDALRVLLKHSYTLCPDRRITGDGAVIWYQHWGVLAWNPQRKESLKALAAKAAQLTRTEDFPQELSVWDESGQPLRNQVVPAFRSRCAEEIFSHCFDRPAQ